MKREIIVVAIAIVINHGVIFQDSALASNINNPSFETGYAQWDPPGWSSNHTGNSAGYGDHLGKRITSNAFEPYWSTDGSNFFYMWTGHNFHTTAGDYINLYQSVDFTGITVISFDAKIYAPIVWSGTIQSQFVVDDTILWTADLKGEYLNQTVDVSGFTGINTLELRLMVVETGVTTSQWALWDNLRAVPEPATWLSMLVGFLALSSYRSIVHHKLCE